MNNWDELDLKFEEFGFGFRPGALEEEKDPNPNSTGF